MDSAGLRHELDEQLLPVSLFQESVWWPAWPRGRWHARFVSLANHHQLRGPGRLHHWPYHQWLDLGVAWLQEDYDCVHDVNDRSHIHTLLLHWAADIPSRGPCSGNSLGNIPDPCGHLRRRCVSLAIESIHDVLDQHVLGYWHPHIEWHSEWPSATRRPVGLPYTWVHYPPPRRWPATVLTVFDFSAFALQWFWPIPILIGTIFAPESPWWLIRKNRIEEARAAIRRLTTPSSGVKFDLDSHIEMMCLTNQFEIQVSSGAHYWDCFRGADLRRTEIAAMVWVTQAFCGVPFMGFGVQFMIQAGLDTANSFALSLGQNGISLIGCLIAWYLMTHIGRRTLYIYGLSAMFVILMIIGFLGIPNESAGTSWAVGALIIVMLFAFQLTVGPTCYAIVAEIPSTRLRIKTVALARAFYNAAGFVTNALMPKIVGKNDWNWGAKGGFFWAGVDFLFLVWTFFRLPEPKGLTYSELDLLFEHRIGARGFSQEAADLLKPELEEVARRQEKAPGVTIGKDWIKKLLLETCLLKESSVRVSLGSQNIAGGAGNSSLIGILVLFFGNTRAERGQAIHRALQWITYLRARKAWRWMDWDASWTIFFANSSNVRKETRAMNLLVKGPFMLSLL